MVNRFAVRSGVNVAGGARSVASIFGTREPDSARINSAPVSIAGHLARLPGVNEAVVQHGDGGHAEQRAVHRTDAAENARAAEHHRRDREQFVARARVRLRLAEPRGVNDRRQRRRRPREHVDQRDAAVRPEARRSARLPAQSRSRGTSARMSCDAPAARSPTATSDETRHICAGTPSQRSWPRNRNDAGKFVNVSTPRVIASARPRKSENVPSVTISGGRRSPVMSAAFNPPASAPMTSVHAAATGTGRPASRHSLPNRIAHSPSSEPTDRSMPPVRMIGVIASASRPISTEWRTMSNSDCPANRSCRRADQTLRPRAYEVESATSSAMQPASRIVSCREQAMAFSMPDWSIRDSSSDVRHQRFICFFPASQAIRHDGQQDDRALNRFLPIRLDVQMRQRRADAREQQQAQRTRPTDSRARPRSPRRRRPPRRWFSIPARRRTSDPPAAIARCSSSPPVR